MSKGKIAAIVIGVIVVFVGLIVTFVVSMLGGANNDFKVPVQTLLQDADKGYALFTPELQKVQSEAEYKDTIEKTNKYLGDLVEVGNAENIDRKIDGDGSFAEVEFPLKYSKTKTTGKFKLIQRDGKWLFLSYNVPFPDDALPKADKKELETITQGLNDDYSNGRLVALYEKLSAPLKKEVPPDKFQTDIQGILDKVGKIKEAKLASVEDNADKETVVTYDATFESGVSGKLIWTFFWKGIKWELIGYDIVAK